MHSQRKKGQGGSYLLSRMEAPMHSQRKKGLGASYLPSRMEAPMHSQRKRGAGRKLPSLKDGGSHA